MPSQPFVPTPPDLGNWTRVGTAHEAKKWETEETINRPLAAIDYGRAQDERWARISPRLIEALDKLLGPTSELEPPDPIIHQPDLEDLPTFSDFYGQGIGEYPYYD